MKEKGLQPEDVRVNWQETPNPFAQKFIANYPFKLTGKATFSSLEEAQGIPLVEGLLNLVGAKQVFLFENTLTLTHEGTLTAEDMKDFVIAVIKTRMPVHQPHFESPNEDEKERKRTKDYSNLSDERKQIEEILDRNIRPGLQADGGDVDVISFENDEVKILYQGACGGCPSALMGTLDAIQQILRHEMENENLIVIPI